MPSSIIALMAWKVIGAKAIFCASKRASMARRLSSLYLSKEYLDLSMVPHFIEETVKKKDGIFKFTGWEFRMKKLHLVESAGILQYNGKSICF